MEPLNCIVWKRKKVPVNSHESIQLPLKNLPEGLHATQHELMIRFKLTQRFLSQTFLSCRTNGVQIYFFSPMGSEPGKKEKSRKAPSIQKLKHFWYTFFKVSLF